MGDPQRELEHLRALATAHPTKRFTKLLKIVRQEAFLHEAWANVRTNHGSRTPGVDGQTKTSITATTITTLAHNLKTRQYKPKPVRRVYIPKGHNQRRGLGIPTLQDRIVQAAVAQVLEAIYEPIFRSSSYGFRSGRSTIHALRHTARAFRAGATWVIEGDLVKCFDSIPHAVILACLRKRIKDEAFIDLIRRMLQAGVMEDGRYEATYSGTPQGGLCSPILMNIVMHEFDCWMEDQQCANPPPPTPEQRAQRRNPEYQRCDRRIQRWKAQLKGKHPLGRQTPEGLRHKLKAAIAVRKQLKVYLPRQAIYYCRYADDYVVVLCGYAKADAQHLKEKMAEWLHTHLGLTQHPDKTGVTHWTVPFQFLGYRARGQRNPNGTRWLRVTIPPQAERQVKQRLKVLCGYTQIPELDLFTNVSALLRGWTNYYRYAANAPRRFGRLTGVVFWLTAHYLGRKHRKSIRQVMHRHSGVDPATGRRALYITAPNGTRRYIWNHPPQRQSILSGSLSVEDRRPAITTSWAEGHSYEQRQALEARFDNHCQHCGKESEFLMVHHPNRLGKRAQLKQGPANIIQSALEQQAKWLCPDCHKQHHHGRWNDAKAKDEG